MIKILSGLSTPIGSTVALVNLCNQFNDRGHNCILYGPDRWHLDKCRGAGIDDFHPEEGDIIIVHNIKLYAAAELYKVQDAIERLKKTYLVGHLQGDDSSRAMPRSRKHGNIKLVLTCQENDIFPIRRLKYSLFDKIHCADFSQVSYHKIVDDYFICPNFCNHLTASEHKPQRIAGVIGSIRKENQIERVYCQSLCRWHGHRDHLWLLARSGLLLPQD